jgi:hypothetical protein
MGAETVFTDTLLSSRQVGLFLFTDGKSGGTGRVQYQFLSINHRATL